MQYRGHLFVGLIAFFLAWHFAKPSDALLLPALATCLLFSLLPDLDQASSKIQNIFESGIGIAGLALLSFYFAYKDNIYLVWLAFLLVLLALINFLRHRTIMHTIRASLVMSIFVYLISKELALFAFFGYVSHLVADKMLKF